MSSVIVQVVQHLRPGGIETMALDLLPHYQDKGDAHIVSLDGNACEAIDHWPRLLAYDHQLHFLEKPLGIHLATVYRLARLFKSVGATAVHSHHIGPLFYTGLAAKIAGIKVHVHTEHDAWHLDEPKDKQLQQWLLKLFNPLLVADCQAVADHLIKHIPDAQPKVILNGIDTERFAPASTAQQLKSRLKFNLPTQIPLIGCAARLETVKGHRYLLEALSLLENQEAGLVLAGGGRLRAELEQLADQLGIRDRIYFLGAIDDMVSFYHAIDIFCLPSLNEGLPLSPLEAQSCGRPAVVSNVGGCGSIVCPSSGALVPPGESATLAAALNQVLQRSNHSSPRHFVKLTGDLNKTAHGYLKLLQPRHSEESVCY